MRTLVLLLLLILGVGMWLVRWNAQESESADVSVQPQSQLRADSMSVDTRPRDQLRSVADSRAESGATAEDVAGEEAAVSVSPDEDRSSWSRERWLSHHLESYKVRFIEASNVGAKVEAGHTLLLGSIGAILDAQGMSVTPVAGEPFPSNKGDDFGFMLNGKIYKFGPNEFPEYEVVQRKWSRLGKPKEPGEPKRAIGPQLEAQILARMAEAQLILRAQ